MRSLRPTSAYGIRKYLEGSVLDAHVDVLNTHVLSAVYVVESFNLTQPWYMEMVLPRPLFGCASFLQAVR